MQGTQQRQNKYVNGICVTTCHKENPTILFCNHGNFTYNLFNKLPTILLLYEIFNDKQGHILS